LSRNSQGEDIPLRHAREALEAGAAVFAAPWEAEAFSLALTLSSQGVYSWREWTEVLGDELACASETGGASSYYLHWLAALERLAIAKGIVDESALDIRKRQWIEALHSTPHGQPVELSAATGVSSA
jgi:nitrile hydratase accessory protein